MKIRSCSGFLEEERNLNAMGVCNVRKTKDLVELVIIIIIVSIVLVAFKAK